VRAIGGVDGVDVRGLVGPDLGLIVDIGDREVSVAATAHIEELAVRIINQQTELEARREGDGLLLRWADPRLEAEDLGRIIHTALKANFVLSTISVSVIFDPLRIASLRPGIYSYRDERDSQLKRRSDDNSPLIACRACSAYAPHALCMVTPERPPCCGRSYDELATLAQLTTGLDQLVVDRGIPRDRTRGHYVGLDKQAALLSGGALPRLNLHGLREAPHPLTAIPQCIAWVMDEADSVGIVSADYAGRTPDGKTFESLLARAAGRQLPGCVGVGEDYILSPRFLSGEGGLARVAWMNSALKTRLKLRAEHILTENECTSLAGLKEHLAAGRR
jgi:CO dehydrogenase/acetyl-CoA synthase beta subunit